MSIQNNNLSYDNMQLSESNKFCGVCNNGHLVTINFDEEHLAAHAEIAEIVHNFLLNNPDLMNMLCNGRYCSLGLDKKNFSCDYEKNGIIRLICPGDESYNYDAEKSTQISLTSREFAKVVELNNYCLPSLQLFRREGRPQKEPFFSLNSSIFRELIPDLESRNHFFVLLYKQDISKSKKNSEVFDIDEDFEAPVNPASYKLRTAFELTQTSIKVREAVKNFFGESKIIAASEFFPRENFNANNNNVSNSKSNNSNKHTNSRQNYRKKNKRQAIKVSFDKEFLASLTVNPWMTNVVQTKENINNNNNIDIIPIEGAINAKEDQFFEDARTIFFVTFASILQLYYEIYDFKSLDSEIGDSIETMLDYVKCSPAIWGKAENYWTAFSQLKYDILPRFLGNDHHPKTITHPEKIDSLNNLKTILIGSMNSLQKYQDDEDFREYSGLFESMRLPIQELQNRVDEYINSSLL